MNKWDSIFGGIMFTAGYICGAYSAPFIITIGVALILGTAWAIVSGWHDYVRGYPQRPQKVASLDEQVDEAIHEMQKNCRSIRPRVNRR